MDENSIQLCPLARVAIALIMGIAASDTLCDAVAPQTWLYALCASTAVAIVLHFVRHHPILHSASLLVAIAICGGLRQSISYESLSPPLHGGEERLAAVVSSPPTPRSRTMRYEAIVADGPLAGRRIYAYLPKDATPLKVGDGITATARLASAYDGDDTRNGNLSARRWLQAHAIVARAHIGPGKWHKARTSLDRLSPFQRIQLRLMRYRSQLADGYRSQLADTDAMAIVAAMTLGDRQQLSPDIRDAYSASGASHILALSGMHLGIIYFMLTLILAHGRRQSAMQAIVLAAVWGYAALSGLSPSIVRSATMYTMFAIGTIFHRPTMSPNTLSMAAIIILALSPSSLWDISFQMSFMAVTGILMFQRHLYAAMPTKVVMRWPPVGWCWSMATVAASAQIMAAPLAAYYFGRFPCYFLLSNLIAIPLATILIYLSMAMLALSFQPTLQGMVAAAVGHIAKAMNMGLGWVASLPGASIDGIRVSTMQLATAYLLIALSSILARYAIRMYRSKYGAELP